MEEDLLLEQIVVVNGLLGGIVVFVELFKNVELWFGYPALEEEGMIDAESLLFKQTSSWEFNFDSEMK